MCGMHHGEVEGLVSVERLYCIKKFENAFHFSHYIDLLGGCCHGNGQSSASSSPGNGCRDWPPQFTE